MKSVLRCVCLAAGLAIFAGAAAADEASDYLAAAGDEVKALSDCAYAHARPLMKSQLSAEDVAARAVSECDDKAGAITVALQGAPTHLPEGKAAETTQAVVDKVIADLTRDVKAKR